jgi:hypothetical protein
MKNVHVYVIDGIATSIAEVGISGSRSSPGLYILDGAVGRAQRHHPVSPDIVVSNVHFIDSDAVANPIYDSSSRADWLPLPRHLRICDVA